MKLTLFAVLFVLSAILVILGAVAAYWVVHEYFGYHGNKSVTFYIGGAFVGYMLTEPFWRLYRKRFPKN